MHHHVIRHAGLSVIYLGGLLTAEECEALRVDVGEELERGVRRFILNFREVRRVVSAGVGVLMGIQHQVESLGGSVLFTRVSPEIRAVFRVSNLDRVMHIVDETVLESDEGLSMPVPPPEHLHALIEECWRRLQESSLTTVPQRERGTEGRVLDRLPAEFSEFIAAVDRHCQRLVEANRALRDLVAEGNLELQHSEARYRSLFENAGDAVLVVEAETGEILQVNCQAAELLGAPAPEWVGRPLAAVLPDLAGLSAADLTQALRQQATQPAEASLSALRADGQIVPVHVTTSAVAPLGQSLVLVHLHDISVFQEVERRLRTQVYQISSLNAIGRRLAATLERPTLLAELVGNARTLLDCAEAALFSLDPQRDRIEAVWTVSPDPVRPEQAATHQREVAKSLSPLRPLLGSPVIAPVDRQHLSPLGAEELIPRPWLRLDRQWASLLITQEGQPAAVLLLARESHRAWEQSDLMLLHSLGTQAGLSLANAVHLQEARRAQREWQQLFENSRDAIGVIDLGSGCVVSANGQWATLTRQDPEQVRGSLFLTAVAEADWPRLYDHLRELVERGEGRWECRLATSVPGASTRRSGPPDQRGTGAPDEPIWVQVRASLVQSEPVALALVILIDITERRRRDQEIKSLSEITTSNPNLVLKIDESGHVLYANPGVGLFLRRAGLAESAVTRLLPLDITARLARLLGAPERVDRFEHTVGERTVLFTMTASVNERVGILHGVEITALKQLEEAIAESEANYRALVEGAIDGICALRDGRFSTVNTRLCEILGRRAEELIGASLRDHVAPADWPRVCEALLVCSHKPGAHEELSFSVLRPGGEERNVRAAFTPATVGPEAMLLGYIEDVTEQRHLQAQIEQMQRIESIGALAGGIAHDFNNILCLILGHVSMLLAHLAPQSDAHRHAKRIEEAAEKGADLTRQLLTFARRGRIVPEVVDLSAAVDECLGLLRRTLGTDVTVEFRPAPQPAPVEIDRAQLRQILINLAVNASEAMPHGGRLALRVAPVVLGAPEVRRMPQAKPGPHVCLEVSDTGCGIAPEVLPHIFEPFFTTKREMQGAGLGLSMVYGMVTHQGGFLDVTSEPGHGTAFRLFFPRSEKTPPAPALVTPEQRAGGTVLVIDDEDLIRDLAREILTDAGYSVLTAPNGADGLEQFRRAIDEVCAVILDIVMPVMGGTETFHHLRRERPALPILVASGYASEEETRELLSQGRSDFLPKPFRREALLDKLATLLAQA